MSYRGKHIQSKTKWWEQGNRLTDDLKPMMRYDLKTLGPVVASMPLRRTPEDIAGINLAARQKGYPTIDQHSPYYILVLGIGRGSEAITIKHVWGNKVGRRNVRLIGVELNSGIDMRKTQHLFATIHHEDFTSQDISPRILANIQRPFFDGIVIANPELTTDEYSVAGLGRLQAFDNPTIRSFFSFITFLAPGAPFVFTFLIEDEYKFILNMIDQYSIHHYIEDFRHQALAVPEGALYQVSTSSSKRARNRSFIVGRVAATFID